MVKNPPRSGAALQMVPMAAVSQARTSGVDVQSVVQSPSVTPLSSGCLSKKAFGIDRGSLR